MKFLKRHLMPFYELESKYPLLRSLFLFQFLSISLGLVLLSLVYSWVSETNVASAMLTLREEVSPKLTERQEDLRAWKHLGLNSAVQGALTELQGSLPLKSIEIVPRSTLTEEVANDLIILPEKDDGSIDLVLVATLDPSKIKSLYAINYITYYLLIAFTILFAGVIYFSTRYIRKHIYSPIHELNTSFKKLEAGGTLNIDNIKASGEMLAFIRNIKEMNERSKRAEYQAGLVEISRQVAHDIRSPLTAMAMLEPSLNELPEEKRILLRTAIERVREIADHWVERSKGLPLDVETTEKQNEKNEKKEATEELATVSVTNLLDSIVMEKQIQFLSKVGLELRLDGMEKGYALFAKVPPTKFKSICSNLINNSQEAITGSGKITISIAAEDHQVAIQISDTGKGIPEKHISKVFQRGFSFEKPKGMGLGLYDARRVIEQWEGLISLDSKEGGGTTVKMVLPQAEAPKWFAKQIELANRSTVIILDDDDTVHQIWKQRFKKLNANGQGVELSHFRESIALVKWFYDEKIPDREILYLMDYELLGQSRTGLQVIQELGIQNQAVLVTNHDEVSEVQDKAVKLGVRLVPKRMANLVPIRFMGEEESPVY